jgi:hypothetical protein
MDNQLLDWLSGGDLRSDGAANEVAEFVRANEALLPDLLAGLSAEDDVVRGRSADALEKVARTRPDLLIGELADLTRLALQDPVPMVRMHMAMLLGHLAMYDGAVEEITETLKGMLSQEGVFARSWAISSLCIMARKHPSRTADILPRIEPLQRDASAAIRTRARKAMKVLTDPQAPFPAGWVKSERLLTEDEES